MASFTFNAQGREFFYSLGDNRILGLHSPLEGPAGTLVSKPASMRIYIEVSRGCNLECGYCYRASDARHLQAHRPDLDGEALFGSLASMLQGLQAAQIVLYGGEPFLRPARVWALLDKLHELSEMSGVQLSVGAISNGTLLFPAVVDELCRRGVQLTVSIDGGAQTSLKGRGLRTLEPIVRALRALYDGGNPATLQATVTPWSIGRFAEDVRFLLGLPVSGVLLLPCDGTCVRSTLSLEDARTFNHVMEDIIEAKIARRDLESLVRIANLKEALSILDSGSPRLGHCGYGYDVRGIAEDGGVYPCPCFIGVEGFREGVEGFPRPSPPSGSVHCRDCVARHTCGGPCLYSCHLASMAQTDALAAMCEIKRMFARAALRVYGELCIEPIDGDALGEPSQL